MAGGGEGTGKGGLETTPTWIVALVCFVIMLISIMAERGLHYLGKKWKKQNKKALHESLLKVKEELMLLGFIAFVLTVFQGLISNICIPAGVSNAMLPCKSDTNANKPSAHYQVFHTDIHYLIGNKRRLLAEESADKCADKGKVQLLSLSAIHQLHIFIFVLAVTHVIFTATTIILGSIKMRQWKRWEAAIATEDEGNEGANQQIWMAEMPSRMIFEMVASFLRTEIHLRAAPQIYYRTLCTRLEALPVASFGKQLYPGVTKSDYFTLRLGFIQTHCPGNPKFDFHNYMIRTLEADFKKVVGISEYLWIFVVIFLLINVNGSDAYFWMAFVPLALLLTVGSKLEHVITQLARDVAQKHTVVEGELVIRLSDDYFWFGRPRFVLKMIHFILFMNAFLIAFFFWSLFSFSHRSCLMGNPSFVAPRLIIGLIVQVLCSVTTLPLYAIVTQMGSSFKRAIFEEHVQEGLIGWAQKAKKRMEGKPNTIHLGGASVGHPSTNATRSYGEIKMQSV